MKNLTPEEAGASTVALAIAKRILKQPAMNSVRDEMNQYVNLWTFTGHLAREVDAELENVGLSFRMVHHLDPDITITPSERGALYGLLAKERK